jgi:putative redox protein
MTFVVSGHQLDLVKVTKAVELSHEKYCSATIMLEKTATITHSIEIVEA